MLNELRKVSPGNAIGMLLAAAVFLAALLWMTVGGDGNEHPSAASSQPAATAPRGGKGGSVGSVVVAHGKVRFSGKLKQPRSAAPGRRAHERARPAKNVSAVAADSASPSLARQLGQMIVSPVAGKVADGPLLARVRAGQVGSVILFGDNIATVAQVRKLVGDLQAAARAGGQPPLLVMTDQEGGLVKRFPSAPPTTSAAQIGASSDPRQRALGEGQATGQALRARGVNVDLAPVADVPVGPTFLSTRAFSRQPAIVATAACQFAAGLHAAGVGAALKHFPGLGRAGNVNTDAAPVTIQGLRSSDLGAYQRCADSPGTMVMIANAVYSGLTGTAPAVLSPATYRLLHEQLGFGGATISDSLNAAAVNRQPELAVRAAQAGVDLELWTSVAGAQTAYGQLLAATRTGRLSRQRVRDAARRVSALKHTLGLA